MRFRTWCPQRFKSRDIQGFYNYEGFYNYKSSTGSLLQTVKNTEKYKEKLTWNSFLQNILVHFILVFSLCASIYHTHSFWWVKGHIDCHCGNQDGSRDHGVQDYEQIFCLMTSRLWVNLLAFTSKEWEERRSREGWEAHSRTAVSRAALFPVSFASHSGFSLQWPVPTGAQWPLHKDCLSLWHELVVSQGPLTGLRGMVSSPHGEHLVSLSATWSLGLQKAWRRREEEDRGGREREEEAGGQGVTAVEKAGFCGPRLTPQTCLPGSARLSQCHIGKAHTGWVSNSSFTSYFGKSFTFSWESVCFCVLWDGSQGYCRGYPGAGGGENLTLAPNWAWVGMPGGRHRREPLLYSEWAGWAVLLSSLLSMDYSVF